MLVEFPICPVCLAEVYSDPGGGWEPCPDGHAADPVWVAVNLWRSTVKAALKTALARQRLERAQQRLAEAAQADKESLIP